MRDYMRCLILAALLAGCDSPTQPASGGSPTGPQLLKQHEGEIVREPISDVLDNPCTGEQVTLTGEVLHIFNGASPDPESGLFTNFEDFYVASGTGLGASGMHYVFGSTDHVVFESPSPPAPQVTFTHDVTFRVVSEDGGGNFIENAVFHFVVTPDGSFTITTDFDRGECIG